MCKQRMEQETLSRAHKIEAEADRLVFSLPDNCDPKFRKSRIDSFRRQARNIEAGNRLVRKSLPKIILELLA